MKRQFTESEWTQILCHPDERQQLTTFFRIWVKLVISTLFLQKWQCLM